MRGKEQILKNLWKGGKETGKTEEKPTFQGIGGIIREQEEFSVVKERKTGSKRMKGQLVSLSNTPSLRGKDGGGGGERINPGH